MVVRACADLEIAVQAVLNRVFAAVLVSALTGFVAFADVMVVKLYRPLAVLSTEGKGTWSSVVGLPAPRYSMASAIYDGKIVVVAGISDDGGEREGWKFDGSSWVAIQDIFFDSLNTVGAVQDGYLYVVRGEGLDTARYDGSDWTPTWTDPPIYPSDAVTRIIPGYTNIYTIGGTDGAASESYTNVYKFDGATFNEISGLPAPRYGVAATVCDGKIYAIGGWGTDFTDVKTNVYRFDGANWSEVAGLPKALAFVGAATLDGKVYSVGGFDASYATVTNVYRFDGTSWTEISGLPLAVYGPSVETLGNNIYAIGGNNDLSGATTNVFKFSK